MQKQQGFQSCAEIEQTLRNGEVIELAMPSDAVGLLLLDACGKVCFVWGTCYHGQDETQPAYSFETVDQALLWIFSQLFSSCMTL